MRKIYVPFGRLQELQDKHLLAVKPGATLFADYQVVRFASRAALISFLRNQKGPGLTAMVKEDVAANRLTRPWLERPV